MRIQYISIINNEEQNTRPLKIPNITSYTIRTELDGFPEKLWIQFFKYEWSSTHYYNRTRNNIEISDNELFLHVHNSDEIQPSINNISETLNKANNFIKTCKRSSKYSIVIHNGSYLEENIRENYFSLNEYV